MWDRDVGSAWGSSGKMNRCFCDKGSSRKAQDITDENFVPSACQAFAEGVTSRSRLRYGVNTAFSSWVSCEALSAPARSSAATTELRYRRGAAWAVNRSYAAFAALPFDASTKQLVSRTSLRGDKINQYEKGSVYGGSARPDQAPF